MALRRKYDTAAQVFADPILSEEKIKGRRVQQSTERARRSRQHAIQAGGALLLTALAVSGAPHRAFNSATDSVKAGAADIGAEIATDVKMFGEATGDNISSVTAPVGEALSSAGDVLATVKHQVGLVLDGEQRMHDENKTKEAEEMIKRGEALRAEGDNSFPSAEQIRSAMGVDQQQGRDIPPAFKQQP